MTISAIDKIPPLSLHLSLLRTAHIIEKSHQTKLKKEKNRRREKKGSDRDGSMVLTCDAAEEPQRGRIAAVLVDHPAGSGLRYGDRQGNRPVELSPAGLHRHDGRDGHPVAQQFHHQFRLYRLRLLRKFQSAGHKTKCYTKPDALFMRFFCFLVIGFRLMVGFDCFHS